MVAKVCLLAPTTTIAFECKATMASVDADFETTQDWDGASTKKP